MSLPLDNLAKQQENPVISAERVISPCTQRETNNEELEKMLEQAKKIGTEVLFKSKDEGTLK